MITLLRTNKTVVVLAAVVTLVLLFSRSKEFHVYIGTIEAAPSMDIFEGPSDLTLCIEIQLESLIFVTEKARILL